MFKARPQSGATLIEINLAIGVLLMGVLGVYSLFPSGMQFAEQGMRSSDASAIASAARAQVELLSMSSKFSYPLPFAIGELTHGLLADNSLPPGGSVSQRAIQCMKEDQSSMGWRNQVWRPYDETVDGVSARRQVFLLITSGGERGRVIGIRDSDPTRLYLQADIAGMRIRRGDSFRILNSKGNIKSIPSGFMDRGETIPSITAFEFDRWRKMPAHSDVSIERLRQHSNAASLRAEPYTRYRYAVLLDGASHLTPGLFPAYVLIFKDGDDAPPTSVRYSLPFEMYTFYYRQPSALQ